VNLEFEEKTKPVLMPKPEDDFIKDVWRDTGICDLETMRLVWTVICQQIPKRLISDQDSINFGWGVLRAFPYRTNWKQIILSKFWRSWVIFSKKKTRDELDATEFGVEIRKTDLIAMMSKGQKSWFRWTVEIEPTKAWEDYSDEIEKSVFSSIGARAYVDRLGGLINRLWPGIVSTFFSFAENTSIPCGSLVRGSGRSHYRLVEYVPDGKVLPCNLEDGKAYVVSDSRVAPVYGIDEETRKGENEDVPELPVVCLH
jgi:hypothetical protein